MDPILSIVIATKDREFYCIEAIKTILSLKVDNFELVISDNSVSRKVEKYVTEHPDRRLQYFYSENTLSVIENYNVCLNAAKGQYVCLIGDDDTVLPEIFDVVDFAIRNNVDAVGQREVIDYLWPSDFTTGHVRIPKYTNRVLKLDSHEILIKYLRKGGCFNPRDAKLPMLYHGIVKRSLLQKIKEETGEILTGISPDSYSACAIAQRIKTHYIYDTPFTIAGACKTSATSAKLMGGHCGELKESTQYNMNVAKGYVWAKDVPEFYSVQTIWADSTLHNMCPEFLQYFRLKPLVARALMTNRHIAKTIIHYTNIHLDNKKKNNKTLFYLDVSMRICSLFICRVVSKIFRTINKSDKRMDGIKHINDITSILSD